jgi:hypothetical protein
MYHTTRTYLRANQLGNVEKLSEEARKPPGGRIELPILLDEGNLQENGGISGELRGLWRKFR